MRVIYLVCSAALLAAPASAANAITKEAVTIDRDSRPYYLFVPDTLGAAAAPLLIVLHGSGRDGKSIVEPFRDLATREHFIVAGPDATDRRGWQVPADGPAFLYFLVEAVKTKHAVDGRRLYLFGHSAGASFALTMGLMESEYFAAVVAHAAALQHESRDQLLAAPRKVPFALFHGSSDHTVPIASGREAREALSKAGFPAELHELPGFEHNTFYTRADAIVRPAWEFLKAHTLDDEPRYQVYAYQKQGP